MRSMDPLPCFIKRVLINLYDIHVMYYLLDSSLIKETNKICYQIKLIRVASKKLIKVRSRQKTKKSI